MKVFDDLRALCLSAGVAGQQEIVDTAVSLLRPLTDECRVDTMGNVLAVRRSKTENAPTVMLEAHLDQVGFMVTHIDDGGFVHVAKAGSPDPRVLVAQEVVVYGNKLYSGVFCSIPPHLSKGEGDIPDIADMGIDVGLTAEQAKESIPLGSRVSFAPRFDWMTDTVVTGPSMDDRAGMAAILHALRVTSSEELPCHVAVAFCVQEEIGARGASPAVCSLQPDVAIATDVSFALTPDSKPHECGELGKGVMIGVSPILKEQMADTLFRLAKQRDIPYQTEIMAGRTGTDADEITVVGTGVPTALLSIPLRYMHTPVEMVDVQDIAAVGDLMAAYLREGSVDCE